MRIKKIELKNFKRFSDLKISHIPETSKLVLLIGSNGSGKSSLFDAFDWLSKGTYKGLPNNWVNYYNKMNNNPPLATIEFHDDSIIKKNDTSVSVGMELAKKFFGRSSIRIVPQINSGARISLIESDQDSPTTYIDNDQRFNNDISLYMENIDQALRTPVFKGEAADTVKIFQNFIDPLNSSLLNIFGGNINTTIQIIEYYNATSDAPAKLIFKKGSSKINYDLLSHGEKQVVILLINFIVRKEYYKNSIIFIDEMDCHLNTSLQYSLLNEIVSRWIPDSSQFWTASHALGFIDYARKNENSSIIDFDLLNFDQKQELLPVAKDYLDIYEIAVPKEMLFELFHGKEVILCEGEDDELYNSIGINNKLFSGGKNSGEVFSKLKNSIDINIKGLRDRDWLSDEEIKKIKGKYPNYKILKYRHLENYLYHPDNLSEINLNGFDKEIYTAEITRKKNETYKYEITNIDAARRNYEEFRNTNLKDNNTNKIVNDLESNEFEEFYKFYDMKKNTEHYSKFNLPKKNLVKTKWFKDQITNILK